MNKIYKIKIVGNICQIQAIDDINSKKRFTDLFLVVKYINDHNLELENPSELPENYQKMLKNTK